MAQLHRSVLGTLLTFSLFIWKLCEIFKLEAVGETWEYKWEEVEGGDVIHIETGLGQGIMVDFFVCDVWYLGYVTV
jgi:hypothetical protein